MFSALRSFQRYWSGDHDHSHDIPHTRPITRSASDTGGSSARLQEMAADWVSPPRPTLSDALRTNAASRALKGGRSHRVMNTLGQSKPSANTDLHRPATAQPRSPRLTQRFTASTAREPPSKRPRLDVDGDMPRRELFLGIERRQRASPQSTSRYFSNAPPLRTRTPSLQHNSQTDLSQSIVGSPELNLIGSKPGRKRRRNTGSLINGSAPSVASDVVADNNGDAEEEALEAEPRRRSTRDLATDAGDVVEVVSPPSRTPREFLEHRKSSTAFSPPITVSTTKSDRSQPEESRPPINLTKGFDEDESTVWSRRRLLSANAFPPFSQTRPTRALSMLKKTLDSSVSVDSSLATRESLRQPKTALGPDVRNTFQPEGSRSQTRRRVDERMNATSWSETARLAEDQTQASSPPRSRARLSHAQRQGDTIEDVDSEDELSKAPAITSGHSSPAKPRRTIHLSDEITTETPRRVKRGRDSVEDSPARSVNRDSPDTTIRVTRLSSPQRADRLAPRKPGERLAYNTRRQSTGLSARDVPTISSDRPVRTQRSARLSATQVVKERTPTPPERWSRFNKLDWSRPIVYPASGVRRATVDAHDIERLDEGEFLNDSLIGYALRRIEETMKSDVLFFSSFFYNTLTTKNGSRGFNYDAVKKWTKGKDILSCPFIVVPINLELHWFTAIICNLPRLKPDSTPVDKMEELSLTDPNSQVSLKGRKFDNNKPSIIILDSLGSSRAAEVAALKQYIIAEAKDKADLEVDRADLQGITAKGLPEQSNYCDCGIYLITYLEAFARNPTTFVNKLLRREKVDEEFAGFDASAKRDEIRKELLALHDAQAREQPSLPPVIDDSQEVEESEVQSAHEANKDQLERDDSPASAHSNAAISHAEEPPSQTRHSTPQTTVLQTEGTPPDPKGDTVDPAVNVDVLATQSPKSQADDLEQVPPRPLVLSDPVRETIDVDGEASQDSSGDELAQMPQKIPRNDLLALSQKPGPTRTNDAASKETRQGTVILGSQQKIGPRQAVQPAKTAVLSARQRVEREQEQRTRRLQSATERLKQRSNDRQMQHSSAGSRRMKRNGPVESRARSGNVQTIEID